jgi:hypothetical protein
MARNANNAKTAPAAKAAKPARKAKPVTVTTTKEPTAQRAAKADRIVTFIGASGSNAMVASSATENVVVHPHQLSAVKDLAKVGRSLSALRDAIKALPPKPAKLARGLDTQSAPHSAKAVSDGHRAGKADKPAKAPKPAKVAKEKAPKADANDTRAIKVLDKAYSYGAEGSKRRESWDAAKSSKTVAAYLAAGGKAKYLPRFVAAGAISVG